MKITLEKEVKPEGSTFHIYKDGVWQKNVGNIEDVAHGKFYDFVKIVQSNRASISRVIINTAEL